MKTLYYNGLVYTGTLPLKTAFITDNHIFSFVGENQDAFSQVFDKKIDLHGQFVCPGFNDSHLHILNFGHSLSMIPLSEHTFSLKEMLLFVKEYINKNNHYKENVWIFGRGWNQDYFSDEKRMPVLQDLDSVTSKVPLVLVRCCGHCMAVNSKVLEICEITRKTPDPVGGQIGRDDSGEPDGLLFDEAMNLVYDKLPAPTTEEIKGKILLAQNRLNMLGITSVQTDDYCVFRSAGWKTVNQAYQDLHAEGRLHLRVYEQCNFENVNEIRAFLDAGMHTGVGNHYFKIGPLKLICDGSLGARTAFLSLPYLGTENTYGLPVFSRENLFEMISFAHQNGMQIAVHCIGDRALDWTLDALENANHFVPRMNTRHGIVHCQITRPEQLNRMAKMNLHIYAQSIFLDYDLTVLHSLIPPQLSVSSYAWKTLQNKGCTVSNGSDCPVETPNVLKGIQCAVTRTTLDASQPTYLSHEAFSVQEALDSYTQFGAFSSFDERIKGRIEKNYLADFVVLDANPFTCSIDEIKDISVLQTYLGGSCVYSKV